MRPTLHFRRLCVESLETRLLLAVSAGAEDFSDLLTRADFIPAETEGTEWNITSLSDENSTGTLRYALGNCAAGDTIILNVSGTISVGSVMKITKDNLTIKAAGNQSVILESNGTGYRCFNISSNLTVTLKGLTIQNFSVGSNGSAIYGSTNSNITIDGCTIRNNTNTDTYAGAVGVYGSLTVRNSVISGNRSGGTIGSMTSDTKGGAGIAVLYSKSSSSENTVVIENSEITGNEIVNGYGGGIFSVKKLILKDSSVTGNSSLAGSGGGIYAVNGAEISDSEISGNKAAVTSGITGITTFCGGGIYLDSGTVSITDSEISDNIIVNTSSSDNVSLCGGGIYAKNSKVNITNTLIQKNFINTEDGQTASGKDADLQGAGLYLLNCINTQIKQSLITGNLLWGAAGRQSLGSGVLVKGDTPVNLYYCTIADNKILGSSEDAAGAGLCSDNGTVNLYGSLLYRNSSLLNEARSDVSSVNITETLGTVLYYTAYGKAAAGTGGVLALTDPDNHQITAGTSVFGADGYELSGSESGLIDISNQTEAPWETDLAGNSRLIGSALEYGCYEYVQDVVVSVNTDNGSDTYPLVNSLRWAVMNAGTGGYSTTIKFSSNVDWSKNPITLAAPLTVSRSLTIQGDSDSPVILDGGNQYQIMTLTGEIDVRLEGLRFQNGSGSSGAALYADAGLSSLSISNCTFAENNGGPNGYGGAVMIAGAALSEIQISDSVFSSNTTGKQAGALGINGAEVNILNTLFSENSAGAGYNGGAILNTGVLSMTGGSFENNTVSDGGNGGAVSILAGGTADFTCVSFIGNSTGSADPKYSDQSSSSDTRSGGAIRVHGTGSELTLTDCSFTGNSAYFGGALSVSSSGTAYIYGGQFGTVKSGNTAVFGGAILNAGLMSIASSGNGGTAFVNNLAGGTVIIDGLSKSGNGGAVNNSTDGNLTINDARFEGNSAISRSVPDDFDYSTGGFGGAVSNWETMTIADSEFLNNTAQCGGAIVNFCHTELTEANLSLNDVTLTGNKAAYGGGLLNTGYTAVSGLTASENSAYQNGGAVSNTSFTKGDALYSGILVFSENASLLTENTCNETNGYGGGILTTEGTVLTLSVNVTTSGNSGTIRQGKDFASDSAELTGYPDYLTAQSIFIAGEDPIEPTLATLIESMVLPTTAALDDIDGDLFIGPGDYSFICAAWFSKEGDSNWNPRADIDGDGTVGTADLCFVASHWLEELSEEDLTYIETVKEVFSLPDDFEICGGETSY